jgi:ABC-type multidrug transport system ATPase subunit
MLILLVCVTWYVDWLQVSQDESRPFYYPFTLLFPKEDVVVEEEKSIPLIEQDGKVRAEMDAVVIENVSKLYNGATTKALSNISFSFSKGEMFGLLGYNGAGKSTLINILCGVLYPTSGSVKVFGIDASKNRFEIAKKTGICSQQDILFDDLTVEEHLYYFGMLRHVKEQDIKKKIDDIVKELKMEAMLNSMAGVVSGIIG